ncbi:transcription factor MYBS3-like [Musa acuminata AAA Group]|uniref:transcription factor MYBS3-like n=1 Tax=Musa acuminata AAA Group TaxID=214697 RepID=UPI0031D1F64B
MARRCSHCNHNGHNSRTCPNRGVKLFGVHLTDGSVRKSASMGNLSLLAGSSGGASPADGTEPGGGAAGGGYASEDFVKGSSSSCRERKKGTPWTEEEHRMFLLGLQKLGKGDWRGISRTYVASRTPTQVASHAQKYFIRKTNITRRKRRSSLFDMVPDEEFPMSFQESEAQNNNLPPVPPTLNEECESMDSNDATIGEAAVPQPEAQQCSYPVILPAYFSPLLQFPFPCWPGYKADTSEQQAHEIIKPTAVHSKTPMNIDELVGMSKLSIGESRGSTLDLLGRSKRQSAFHASPSTKAQA